jgi:hypothetical protein
MLESLESFGQGVHVFCDLDKTYLETEFESWIKMAKIPFESPHDKITVPGASEVLEFVRWGGEPRRSEVPRSAIHFVSSSPPQLRLALDGKLTMDNLEWSSDTFKNQSYNLKMARIDLLRHHIAYKTKAILDVACRLPPASRLLMFGDNAEFDAYIYTGVRMFLEKRVDQLGLKDWLRGAKVEEAVISQVVRPELQAPDSLEVVGIFIRNVPGYSTSVSSRFEATWFQFDHWLQVAWSLIKMRIIDPAALPSLLRNFHNYHGVPLAHLRWCLYRLTANVYPDQDIQVALERSVELLGTIGASGPSRRMCSWDFECNTTKSLDVVGGFDARHDSQHWYQSIEVARVERRRGKGQGVR